MNFKQFWKFYFTYQASELRAIRLMLFFIIVLMVATFTMDHWLKPNEFNINTYAFAIDSMLELVSYKDSIEQSKKWKNYKKKSYAHSIPNRITPFYPDTLSKEGWMKLGLTEKQADVILSIRQKKGGFHSENDLSNIQILHQFFPAIQPFLKFDTLYQASTVTKQKKEYAMIEINTALPQNLIELPGIGEKLANRIVLYRENLGGFYNIEQLKDMFGMPETTFVQIRPYLMIEKIELKQLQVNYASKQELSMHPYIDFKIASSIVNYRNAHGNFKDVHDLLKFGLVEQKQYDKIAPYLTIK